MEFIYPKCKEPITICIVHECDYRMGCSPSLRRRALKCIFVPVALDSRNIDHVLESVEMNIIMEVTMLSMLKIAERNSECTISRGEFQFHTSKDIVSMKNC